MRQASEHQRRRLPETGSGTRVPHHPHGISGRFGRQVMGGTCGIPLRHWIIRVHLESLGTVRNIIRSASRGCLDLGARGGGGLHVRCPWAVWPSMDDLRLWHGAHAACIASSVSCPPSPSASLWSAMVAWPMHMSGYRIWHCACVADDTRANPVATLAFALDASPLACVGPTCSSGLLCRPLAPVGAFSPGESLAMPRRAHIHKRGVGQGTRTPRSSLQMRSEV